MRDLETIKKDNEEAESRGKLTKKQNLEVELFTLAQKYTSRSNVSCMDFAIETAKKLLKGDLA